MVTVHATTRCIGPRVGKARTTRTRAHGAGGEGIGRGMGGGGGNDRRSAGGGQVGKLIEISCHLVETGCARRAVARLPLSRPTPRHDPATRQPTSPTARLPFELLRSASPCPPAPACARSDDDVIRIFVHSLDTVERAHKNPNYVVVASGTGWGWEAGRG